MLSFTNIPVGLAEHVELEEMYRTFNMWVGMVLVVSWNVDAVLANHWWLCDRSYSWGSKGVEFI